MYFPEHMNFQYFFFNTYPGYFLQALPIAVLTGALYGAFKFRRRDEKTPVNKKVWQCLLIGYLTGLVLLTLGLDMMGIGYYRLFYGMDPGRTIRFFSGDFDLVPNLSRYVSSESIGNFLMFLPFGVLHPLSQARPGWKKTALSGAALSLGIEILQPVLGRAFDINDLFLNALGVFASATIFFVVRKAIK